MGARRDDHLFANILVPVSGQEGGWFALNQALDIAHLEDARLLGLHITRDRAQVTSEATTAVQEEFDRLCGEASVSGQLAIETGNVARRICDRARWTDLVVIGLAHPPAPQPVAKLSSGFRTLIRRCARPVLAVPMTVSPMSRPLLAYDGSPKAEEATG